MLSIEAQTRQVAISVYDSPFHIGIFNIENSLKSDYYSYFCVVDIRRTLKCPGVQKGNIHDFQEI